MDVSTSNRLGHSGRVKLKKRAAGRPNWVVGSGGDMMNKVMARMYAKGYIGPLWKKLMP